MDGSPSDAILLRLKWRLAFNGWEWKLARWAETVKAGFDPNQPRVPAGNPDGGQWTGTGGPRGGTGQILSDATPGNLWRPGVRVAQAGRPRGSGFPIRFGGQTYDATAGQAARYSAADARASAELRRIREIDPKWKPRQSLAPPQSAEGAIAIRRGEAREAEARLRELARQSPSKLIDTYRTLNNSRDLFGNETWPRNRDTVAITTIGRTPFTGINSNAPTFTTMDREAARVAVETLVAQYPRTMRGGNLG